MGILDIFRSKKQTNFLLNNKSGRGGKKGALNAGDEHGYLRLVVSRIAGSVAQTTWVIHRADSAAKGLRAGRIAEKSVRSKMVGPAIDAHPFLDVLHGPTGLDAFLTGRDVTAYAQACLDLAGNAYLLMPPEGPVALVPLCPTDISEVATQTRRSYKLDQSVGGGEIPADQVLWMRSTSYAAPYGVGVGQAAAIGAELQIEEFLSDVILARFGNGGRPDAILAVPGMPEKVSDEVQRQFADKFREPGKIWVTGATGITYQDMQRKYADKEILELKQEQRAAVRLAYGVPPEILGDVSNSNRSTIAAAEDLFWSQCVQPRVEYLRNAYQSLLSRIDPTLVLDYVDREPRDKTWQRTAMQLQPQAFTVDEWRAQAGYAPLPPVEQTDQESADKGAAESANTWTMAVSRMLASGLRVDEQQVLERLGLEQPSDDARLLTPPTTTV